jgi:hypothetical protein
VRVEILMKEDIFFGNIVASEGLTINIDARLSAVNWQYAHVRSWPGR